MIIIYCRKAVDWQNYTFEDVAKFNPLGPYNPQEITNKLIEQIKKWNQTFNVSFFKFRHKINLIAKSNWGNWNVVNSLNLNELQDDDLIVPTDDDDWFHPDLVNILQGLSQDFIYWNNIVCRTYTDKIECGLWFNDLNGQAQTIMSTNNYAIRVSLLKNMKQEDRDLALQRHGFAMSAVCQYPVEILGMLNKTLSCYNVHIATTSNMIDWKNKRGSDGIKVSKGLPFFVVPDKYGWINPWFNSLKELTLKLQPFKIPVL